MRALLATLFNWLVWFFMALLVFSQFLGIIWNTIGFEEKLFYGQIPATNAPEAIAGTNDEPFTDRNVVCMAQGRSYVPMQLSKVLADPKLASVVDTSGESISGYRVIKRELIGLDASSIAHFTRVCERIDYSLDAIQESCNKMGYNITRDSLRIVDDVFSTTTKEIPRALPILIMPFWDNGVYAHYAIPGWDGMACVFRLDGLFVIFDETAGVLRGAPRALRESRTVEWLAKPGGVWRNGWYEDGSGQRWSSDMMTTQVDNRFGISARQFDTIANEEIDCTVSPVPRNCLDFPQTQQWGQQSKIWDDVRHFNQVFISNGAHFGLFLFEAHMKRTIENKYSLETFISNVSVVVLLFRWFVSMAAMLNSYRLGVAPWQTTGIGCLSSSRTFNVLPIVLLPRLKMTMAAFWTVGCEFEGSQRALGEAWFAVYPAIAELMLLYFSLINTVAKVTHRRVDDSLFGPTLVVFALLHRYRQVNAGWLGFGGRIQVTVTSEEFDGLGLPDLFTPHVALRMNGNIGGILYFKLAILALNLVPLLLSKNMGRSSRAFCAYAVCDIEKTLALRASAIGGLGLSAIYTPVEGAATGTASSAGPLMQLVNARAQAWTRVGILRARNNVDPGPTPTPAGDANQLVVVPFDASESENRNPLGSSKDPTGISISHHAVIGFEINRLGYLVFGGKYLITYDDWYILTSMAPLRFVEKLWNHRISVFDVVKREDGYFASHTARLCRLDDEQLCAIPFYDVTLCAFR